MKSNLHIIELPALSIDKQLALEEALLRADTRNFCLLNTGSPPAIVLGISGKIDLLLDKEKLETQPLPLIRRFSGGGTVCIDPNTAFVTFIGNQELINTHLFPQNIMKWTAKFYQPLFAPLNFSIQENDYVSGEKKFGGNAQYICKKRFCHHSSLLFDFDEQLMEYLLHPPKTPTYRKGRDHSAFLTRLKPHFPSKQALFDQLIQQLKKHFYLNTISEEELEEVRARPHRKATHLIKKDY